MKRGLFLFLLVGIFILSAIQVLQHNGSVTRVADSSQEQDFSNTLQLASSSSLLLLEPAPPEQILSADQDEENKPEEGQVAEDGVVDISGFLSLMKNRTQRVRDICNGMSIAEKRLKVTANYKYLRILHERALAYCPIFKASSSNWRENFFELYPMPEV